MTYMLYDARGKLINTDDTRYTDASTVDWMLLGKLGFSGQEISALRVILNTYFIVNHRNIQEYFAYYGITPNILTEQRLMYAYRIITGKDIVDEHSYKSVSRHIKKMNRGSDLRLSMDNLAIRGNHDIPRTAVIDGLTGPFEIWNSRRYPPVERTYEVIKIAKEYVTIKTDRIPRLKYNDSLEVPGVLNILENKNGIVTVRIHKKYCRLCNRFVILVSKNNPDSSTICDADNTEYGILDSYRGQGLNYTPEGFHACSVIVAGDGTILYVYAKTMEKDAYGNPKASFNDQINTRIMDYGFYKSELLNKLAAARNKVAKVTSAVWMKDYQGNCTYVEIDNHIITESDPDEDDIIA